MRKYREPNERARQNYPIQRQQQNTQKRFHDFFRNNQDLLNEKEPNTLVSPHRSHQFNDYRRQSKSPQSNKYSQLFVSKR